MKQMEQDLAFVREVVESSRRALRVDALPLVVWAALSLCGVILVYLFDSLDSIWLWLALIGLAWAFTGWRVVQTSTQATLFSQRALASLWFGLLSAMTLIGFVGAFSGQLPTATITPIVASLFGVGYLVSAALMDRRWLAGLAVAWWLGSTVLFFMPTELRLAIFGLMIGLLLLAPALVLHRRPPPE